MSSVYVVVLSSEWVSWIIVASGSIILRIESYLIRENVTPLVSVMTFVWNSLSLYHSWEHFYDLFFSLCEYKTYNGLFCSLAALWSILSVPLPNCEFGCLVICIFIKFHWFVLFWGFVYKCIKGCGALTCQIFVQCFIVHSTFSTLSCLS